MALIDVTEDIAAGREPFPRIIATVEALAPDEDLELVVPFEPAPLYEVMTERGFTHEAEQRPNGVWHVIFRRSA